MRRIILQVLGTISLILGGIGIVIPLFPTTPFVILAAGCYASSNKKMFKLLENSKFFGEYITNYQKKTGIYTKTKVYSLIFLWGMLAFSALFIKKPLIIFFLILVGILVTLHITLIKTKRNPS